MNYKRLLATTMVLATFILTAAFTIDCWGGLTYDIDSAIAQYERDRFTCAKYSLNDLVDDCYLEADVAFNFNVDVALDLFERCCCVNNQACC